MSSWIELDSNTDIIQVTALGPILRISFSGTYFVGVGQQLGDYLAAALRQHRPAAVILDFTHFRYGGGNDLGQIVQAFFIKTPDDKVVLRPCAIVAAGRTAKFLLSLLSLAKVLETFDLKFFEDVGSAAEHLRGRVEALHA